MSFNFFLTPKETDRTIHIAKGTVAAAVIAVAALMAVITLPVFAQDRSGEVLKELEKKETLPQEKPEGPPVIQQEIKKQPAALAAEGGKIHVKAYNIQGAAIISQESLNAILAPYTGKDLTLGEITQAADAITDAYRPRLSCRLCLHTGTRHKRRHCPHTNNRSQNRSPNHNRQQKLHNTIHTRTY